MPEFRTLAAALILLANTSYAADPLRPPQALMHQQAVSTLPAEAQPSRLDLSSILYSSQRRLAVINGQRLQEGDTVAGARVLKITADRVRVKRSDKTLTLRLHTATGFKQRINAND